MADNVFQLLQQAWSTAKTSDANIFGVEIAIVTNVQDPDKQGKVKVCFPRLPGKPESGWARVAQPHAGDGRGFYWLPQVNDEVLVAFERGQSNRPYVIGSVWNGKDKPMKDAYTDENTNVMVQTTSGHQVILYDKDGEEKIVIADKSGKRTVTWDVKGKKFLIEAKEGDVEFHAEKKIVLQCEDIEIKTKKSGKVDIGDKFELNVKQKAGFKAGPQMNMKADKVNLNPPSLDLAALVAAALAAAARAAAAAAGANAEQQAAAAAAAAALANAITGGGGDLASDLKQAAKDAVEAAEKAVEDALKKGQGGLDGSDWTKANQPGGGSGDSGSQGQNGQQGGQQGQNGQQGQAGAAPGPNDVSVTLEDSSGNPVPSVDWKVTLPDGTVKTGKTGDDGKVSVAGAQQGQFKLELPSLDGGSAGAQTGGDTKANPGDVAVTLKDSDGNPVGGVKWQVSLPDNTTKSGTTGDDGKISVTGTQMSGQYKIVLPDVDAGQSGSDGGSAPGGPATDPDKAGQPTQPDDTPAPDGSGLPTDLPDKSHRQTDGAQTAPQDDEAKRYDWVKSIVESTDVKDWSAGTVLGKGIFDTQPWKMNVLGLRGWIDGQGKVTNTENKWNDTFYVAYVDDQGVKRCEAFLATTDPGHISASEMNAKGVAHLCDNQYRFKRGRHHGSRNAMNQAEPFFVWRDPDQHGTYQGNELIEFGWFGINNHDAYQSGSTVGDSSEGCQVVWGDYTKPQVLRYFWLMGQDPEGVVKYTLRDANDVGDPAYASLKPGFDETKARTPQMSGPDDSSWKQSDAWNSHFYNSSGPKNNG